MEVWRIKRTPDSTVLPTRTHPEKGGLGCIRSGMVRRSVNWQLDCASLATARPMTFALRCTDTYLLPGPSVTSILDGEAATTLSGSISRACSELAPANASGAGSLGRLGTHSNCGSENPLRFMNYRILETAPPQGCLPGDPTGEMTLRGKSEPVRGADSDGIGKPPWSGCRLIQRCCYTGTEAASQ